eukprot:4468980-Alexandrium_andersonii.AAC.1
MLIGRGRAASARSRSVPHPATPDMLDCQSHHPTQGPGGRVSGPDRRPTPATSNMLECQSHNPMQGPC